MLVRRRLFRATDATDAREDFSERDDEKWMKRATPWRPDEAHKLADTLSYANDHGQNVKLDYRPVISHTLDEAEMKVR